MSQLPDENAQLTRLLQTIPAPEPPADFLAGARRRYREAIDARYRREIFTSFAAGLLGLMLVAFVLIPTVEPAGLIAWLAEATADVARWMTGAAVILSLVPLTFWTAAALGFVASALSLVLLARARSLAVVK